MIHRDAQKPSLFAASKHHVCSHDACDGPRSTVNGPTDQSVHAWVTVGAAVA